MTVTEISDNLFYVEFTDSSDMCMTMIRLQEFYESPFKNIRGKAFTLEEYVSTYIEVHGKFDYETKWNGFNVPDYAIREFINLCFPFRKEEIALFGRLKKALRRNRFYLIAGLKNDTDTLMHEAVHGLFYLNAKYRAQVIQLMRKVPQKWFIRFCTVLADKGYIRKVWVDEINAYSVCAFYEKRIPLNKFKLTKLDKTVFKKFYDLYTKYSHVGIGAR